VPRKQDPIFAVMDFFENEPLAVARSTFSLVKRALAQREALEAPPAPTRKRKGRKSAAPTIAPAVEADAPASTPPIAPTPPPPPGVKPVAPRKRKPALSTPAAAQESAAPDTIQAAPAFPGLGPATVGD